MRRETGTIIGISIWFLALSTSLPLNTFLHMLLMIGMIVMIETSLKVRKKARI